MCPDPNSVENDNKIEVLSDLEAVQSRPNMYLGMLYDATQLLVEILDNSLDELANDFTDEVKVNIYPDCSVVISDRGRGIPIHDVEVNGVLTDSIITSATKLHSGGKFNNSTANYKITIGLHGVGLVAVNALCEYMVICVAKNEKLFTYNFSFGKFTHKTERLRKPEDASTTVTFKPVAKYFNKLGYNTSLIQKRLYLISAHVLNSKVYLNDQLIPHIPMKELARSYLDVDESHQIFELNVIDGDEKAKIFITYDNEKRAFGDVNLNICGGGYLSAFETIFSNSVVSKYPNLTKNNSLANFKFYCSLSIKEPRFDAQTKGRMVKDTRLLLRQVIPSLERMLDIPFFKEYLTDLSESKILNSASKKLKRKTIVSSENPLQDCRNRPGDILYILEGDSAGGTLKKFRDKNTEAIFPLSGKILNTTKKSIDKALESGKVKFLLEAIGVDPTGRRKDFRYNTIKVISDADCLGPDNTVQFIKDGILVTGKISEMENKWEGGLIPSLNSKTNEIELKPIIGFVKKPTNGRRMMNISTRANHQSTFTEDHEMFVTSKKQGIRKVALKDINPNIDYLVRSDMILDTFTNDIKVIDIRNDICNIVDNRNTIKIRVLLSDFKWDCDDDLIKADISGRVIHITKAMKSMRDADIPFPTWAMYKKGIDNTSMPMSRLRKLLELSDIQLDLNDMMLELKYDNTTMHYANNSNTSNANYSIPVDIDINCDLAYLVGQYIGDGYHGSSKNNKYSIGICSGDGRYLADIMSAMENIGINCYTMDVSNNCKTIVIKSVMFQSVLNHFGLNRACKHNSKFIPDAFKTASTSVRISLLKGLYHSDGSLFKNGAGHRLNYATVSRRLTYDIVDVLKSFGVFPLISKSNACPAGLNPNGVAIIGNYARYNININRNNELSILSEVIASFSNIDELDITLNESVEGVKIIPISYIEDAEPCEYIYCFEVEDNHNFACGTDNVIVSNCDGSHITVLVTIAIWRYAKHIIEDGNLVIIMPPLYGTRIKGEFIPIYSNEEMEVYRSQNYEISRFKGLGEMDSSDLEAVIRGNSREYTVQVPKNKQIENAIKSVMLDTDIKRQLCNDSRYGLETVLKAASNQNK